MPNSSECGVSARKRKSLLKLIDTIDTIPTLLDLFEKTEAFVQSEA